VPADLPGARLTISWRCPLSVLVEAVTLLVRRESLERAYPGGAGAFVQTVRALPDPPRFACEGDGRLVNVSFAHPALLNGVVELLEEHRIVSSVAATDPDYVIVDQLTGPTLPCPWLEWERFTDAVTVAWMEGSEPGALAAPDGWTPPEPRARPGEEPSVEPTIAPNPEPPPATPMHDAVLAALAEAGWTTYHADPPAVMVDLRGEQALYTCRYFVSQPLDAVVCYTRAPLAVPKPARRKTMEFITRANYGLMIGGFEMSLDEGNMFFRATCALEDGVPTARMVCTLANVGVWAFDRYLPSMLEMIYGKRPVLEAVQRAEGS
jgi:hypothetical protein